MKAVKRIIKRIIDSNKLLYCMFQVYAASKNEISLNNMYNIIVNRKNYFTLNNLNTNNEYTLFYIHISDTGLVGFCAIYRWILSGLYISDKLDMQSFIYIEGTPYNEVGGYKGINNLYEYYFENSLEGMTKDQLEGKNYIEFRWYENTKLVDREFGIEDKKIAAGYNVNEDYLKALGRISKKYLHLKPDLEKKILLGIDGIKKEEKTLGIHIRGTDYQYAPLDHPIIATPDQYFVYIDEAIKAYGFKQIFVATDDQKLLDQFIKHYGKYVKYYKDIFRSENRLLMIAQQNDREHNKYLMGEEVLRDMFTLAKCEGLIAGLSQVSICARIQKYANNERFEYIKIIDNGLVKKRSREEKRYMKKYYRSKKL